MSKVLSIAFLVALVAAPGFAQLAGTMGVDLNPGSPIFDAGGAVVDADSDIDTARTVSVGEDVSTLVRLNGAQDLLGVTFDFGWSPANALRVKDIRETRMDLDFSGTQDFPEVDRIVQFFLDAIANPPANVDLFTYAYDDGTGQITTEPGVLMDGDGDHELSFPELDSYVAEFIDNIPGSDVPFWTEVVSRRATPEFNESVEIFDTVADINLASGGTDNTAVLLRRPDVAAAGFGFDGDAIILEIVFEALAAGPATISITNAQGIDENFADIITDVQPITVGGDSVLTVQ